jgi:hypothetical protein
LSKSELPWGLLPHGRGECNACVTVALCLRRCVAPEALFLQPFVSGPASATRATSRWGTVAQLSSAALPGQARSPSQESGRLPRRLLYYTSARKAIVFLGYPPRNAKEVERGQTASEALGVHLVNTMRKVPVPCFQCRTCPVFFPARTPTVTRSAPLGRQARECLTYRTRRRGPGPRRPCAGTCRLRPHEPAGTAMRPTCGPKAQAAFSQRRATPWESGRRRETIHSHSPLGPTGQQFLCLDPSHGSGGTSTCGVEEKRLARRAERRCGGEMVGRWASFATRAVPFAVRTDAPSGHAFRSSYTVRFTHPTATACRGLWPHTYATIGGEFPVLAASCAPAPPFLDGPGHAC